MKEHVEMENALSKHFTWSSALQSADGRWILFHFLIYFVNVIQLLTYYYLREKIVLSCSYASVLLLYIAGDIQSSSPDFHI